MRLPFELDPHLIHHVIHSQAGSIGKALIELIMNAVDAGSPTFELTVTPQGFEARDAGRGFTTEHDVKRYFGRFGTPHQEGDATFGRFRLGRGQIMAHASTHWESNHWSMDVDTQTMGYAFDLEVLSAPVPGCTISGTWYEPLQAYDHHLVIQELRDLVRYTPLDVTLNDVRITKDPADEKWTMEDDLAYYRVRREGAMALYNQGVLVKHDPGNVWGVGGVVVSKKALDLNVSRSEILRKTCPIWKEVDSRLKKLAATFLEKEGPGRQSESARALRARELVMAEGAAMAALVNEKVFTLLPGLRHVSLRDLARMEGATKRLCAVPLSANVTRAEALSQSGLALFFHPRTLDRFECYSPEEFEDLMADIRLRAQGYVYHSGAVKWVPYQVLNDNFIEQTRVVPDQQIKDPETRRAWKCLKRALHDYIRTVRRVWDPEQNRLSFQSSLRILAGHSNTADAWTDGKSYVAIHINFVNKLSGAGLSAAYEILALVDHELAHEGDSLNAVHDEAFYARYHDISITHAAKRHHAIQRFLAMYSSALHQAEDRRRRRGWADLHAFNVNRINHLRQPFENTTEALEEETMPPVNGQSDEIFLETVNHGLRMKGVQPDPRSVDELNEAIERHRYQQQQEKEAQWVTKMAEMAVEAQVEQAANWLRQTQWYGLPCDPLPVPFDPALLERAKHEVKSEEREYTEFDRNQDPAEAETWVYDLLEKIPDYAGDPSVLREFYEERQHEAYRQVCEEEEPDWAAWADEPRESFEQPFDDYFPPDRLEALLKTSGLSEPDESAKTHLQGFHDLVPVLEAFVLTHHRWPQNSDEAWEWDRHDRPALPEGLPLPVIVRLAGNVGLTVSAYLAWRTEQDG